MQTESLQALSGKWPDDAIHMDISNPIGATIDMLTSLKDKDYFLKFLKLDKSAQQAIEAFATANDMVYAPHDQSLVDYSGGLSNWKSLPGWVTSAAGGSTVIAAHILRGNMFGFRVEMFTHMWVYGDDTLKEQRGERGYMGFERTGIIKVKLPKNFPQIVLDSNKNDRGKWSSVSTIFDRNQIINLEGDFQEYFDFYVPKGLQINALTMLAPNFMQVVMDSAVSFDIEFFGDEMILITKQALYTPEAMQSAYDALHEQLQYMSRLLSSWNYVPLSPPIDLLRRQVIGGGYLKLGKKRISPKSLLIGIGVLFAILLGPFMLIALLFIV